MPRIFTFIWNTQSNRLAETANLDEVNAHRESVFSYPFSCNIPDFFPPLMALIKQYDCDIVVIAFQECASPGCYFHSHFLPNEMPKHGYGLIHRTKMMGAGVTTYKAFCDFDLKFRGLRTSVYAKQEYIETIISAQDIVLHNFGGVEKEYVDSTLLRNKGGVAIYVRLPPYGTFAFINCHLPFDSKSLKESALKQDPMIRKNALSHQNICYNEIYRKLILDYPVRPEYVMYMGDLNYRLSVEGTPVTCAKLTAAIETRRSKTLYRLCYENMDELRKQMVQGTIYPLSEGIQGTGPAFMPTGKMEKTRGDGYDAMLEEEDKINYEPMIDSIRPQLFKIGSIQQRCPSFCDRILYTTLAPESSRPLHCIYYERFDKGKTMKLSDHAGVVGIYEVL